MALVRGDLYTYKGRPYERSVRDNSKCGIGNFLYISVLQLNGQRALSEQITMNTQNNYYLADSLNHRIRKVDVVADLITTVAGNSSTDNLSNPGGCASTPWATSISPTRQRAWCGRSIT